MRDGGPAFPCGEHGSHWRGLTVRQWYAGMAIPAVIKAAIGQEFVKRQPQAMARVCFEMADAMIAEGDKG